MISISVTADKYSRNVLSVLYMQISYMINYIFKWQNIILKTNKFIWYSYNLWKNITTVFVCRDWYRYHHPFIIPLKIIVYTWLTRFIIQNKTFYVFIIQYQARSYLYAKNQLLAHHFGKKNCFACTKKYYYWHGKNPTCSV
jgi:hypothetical protein